MRQATSKVEEDLCERMEEIDDLTVKRDSLDRKCIRLREYIKQLTAKCEEWAETYRLKSMELEEVRKAPRDHCSECRVLEETAAAAGGQNSALKSEVARRLKGGAMATPKENRVSWGQLTPYLSRETGPMDTAKKAIGATAMPKTPLQLHHGNIPQDSNSRAGIFDISS